MQSTSLAWGCACIADHAGAVQMLMEHHMLTQGDEEKLLQQLPFRADDTWLRLLYT